MAEAGTSAPSNTSGRFFCHKCNEELSRVLEDFTCPKCKCGFIEQLSDAPAAAPRGAAGVNSAHEMPFLEQHPRGLPPAVEVNLTGPGGVVQQRTNSAPASGARSPETYSFVMDVRPRGGNPPAGGPVNPGQPHVQPGNPMENMLFSFLNDLITGLSGGGVTVGGGFPMMANIGDYVWGRDGLDAIVTQLMNQMEGTGPPPMPTDKLDNLPTVKITADQVERKLQCSVCWDDFNLNESVKQLECDHVFHPDCIVPWLNLHGTCPICRKDLTTQDGVSADPSARFEPPGASNAGRSGGEGNSTRGDDIDRMDYDFD